MSKEERDKERAKRRHKEMVDEQRKMFEQQKKKKQMENGSSNSDGEGSSGDEKYFSIFDEPVFEVDNTGYFSMYDKVKDHVLKLRRKKRPGDKRRPLTSSLN